MVCPTATSTSSCQRARGADAAPWRRRLQEPIWCSPTQHVPENAERLLMIELSRAELTISPTAGALAFAQTRAPESGPPCAHLGQGSTSRGPRAARSCVASRISSASLPACFTANAARSGRRQSECIRGAPHSRPGGSGSPAASGASHRQSCVPKLVSTMSRFKTRVSCGTRFRTRS